MYASFCTTIEFCYPQRSLEFQECLLATITSVLDGSWMLSGGSMITQDCTLVVGKMCNSYSSKIPLRPWVIIKSSGSVVCGHCTCKAGQGETCSDVKAVLSWSKTNACVIDRTQCTSQENTRIELTALEYPLLDAVRYWFHFFQEEGEVYPWMWRANNFFSKCVSTTYGWWAVRRILDTNS